MLLRWFPWKQIVRRLARAHGLVDPVALLSRLESFAQPLEVKEPLELLRAGLVFHARGLLNTGAIQHNLDWIWPYWVERQYDPADESFIPRAFSITHINLTHRNWTAVGLPGLDEFPIVDPRGLLTPFWDGWSLDVWAVRKDGPWLVPSQQREGRQRLETGGELAVGTFLEDAGFSLALRAHVEGGEEGGVCRLEAEVRGEGAGWLVVSLRPYNPEGVSFVHDVRLEEGRSAWRVGRRRRVLFDRPVPRSLFSDYRGGDVHSRLFAEGKERGEVHCAVGMATAAALFPLEGGRASVGVRVPLPEKGKGPGIERWPEALRGAAPARLPDPLFQFLYEAAVRSLVLHAPGGEVYPGPYTYRRFWFRDAAFILHALLCLGLFDRAERILDTFPRRQRGSGFFHSQEGEWDSNGEALWILERFCALSGRPPKTGWIPAVRRGARWIVRKRLPEEPPSPHAGLLPPGFSAEHLGPNDYYYWDDFWGVAGLRGAAALLERAGEGGEAAALRGEGERFLRALERSLTGSAQRQGRAAVPASPYRRLDSGAIGSLAAGYPLQLFPPADPRLLDTAAFLMERCLVQGGFYLDIIHSGINPYLTLHLAQTLLRAGDGRALDLMRATAALASPTGQWPEAVHPRTGGGCMGDGHHVWASAEWVMMVRHLFMREEGEGLVLGAGIFPEWLAGAGPASFGPAPTSFGPAEVTVLPRDGGAEVRWRGQWRKEPRVEVRLPGRAPVVPPPGSSSVILSS